MMAASLAAAFARVDGPELDLIAGYVMPPHEHAPSPAAVKAAFEGFDYRPIRRIVDRLAARYGAHRVDAEDAVQATLLELLVRRPTLYREAPSGWLGLLFASARYRLFDARTEGARVESIEALNELAGDAPFADARPCLPPSSAASEGDRHVPPPRDGMGWTRARIIGALQRFRDYHGRPPRLAECRAVHGLPSSTTIYRRFGSLAEAILAAGMVPDSPTGRRTRWSPLSAAVACRSFRRRNGRWPDGGDARSHSGEIPSEATMIRLFGGTRSAAVQQGAEAILAGAQAVL